MIRQSSGSSFFDPRPTGLPITFRIFQGVLGKCRPLLVKMGTVTNFGFNITYLPFKLMRKINNTLKSVPEILHQTNTSNSLVGLSWQVEINPRQQDIKKDESYNESLERVCHAQKVLRKVQKRQHNSCPRPKMKVVNLNSVHEPTQNQFCALKRPKREKE